MAMGFTRPVSETGTRNLPGGKVWSAHKADNLTANLWADCLENVGALTSLSSVGRQGFTLLFAVYLVHKMCLCPIFKQQ
jgi:hypothetical protein